MSMSWQGIERNKLDYILTDLLPFELSELFSFSAFYNFLLEKKQYKELGEQIEVLKTKKAKSDKVMFKDGWATTPLKYNILKNIDSTREISIIHPFSAINVYLFMECYQKEILNQLETTNCFSIRYHKKNTALYYKGKKNKQLVYFTKESKKLGKLAIQQAGNYFTLVPFESLIDFSKSVKWRSVNFQFRYYAKIDYKSCFDSIYSHSFKWIVERNVIDSKNVSNTNLFITIDRILQNINGRSSNGILVGPEFSRMIAELLLQQIDSEVMQLLSIENLYKDTDYVAFRYVDDTFLFANELKILENIIGKYGIVAQKYLLKLNELKIIKDETPCVPKEWLEKTRLISDSLENIFHYPKKDSSANKSKKDISVINLDSFSENRIKDNVAVLVKKYPSERKTIVSFLISTLIKNISNKTAGYTFFDKNDLLSVSKILDLIFYIYTFYPAFEQTRRLISIITYINKEIEFTTDSKAKNELNKIINRYSFIFESSNIHDLCDWFPFFRQYEIELDPNVEASIIQKIENTNDPILWGNMLLYSQYNEIFSNTISEKIEKIIDQQISKIKIMNPKGQSKYYLEQIEFWYILVFHNCPYIKISYISEMDAIIDNIPTTDIKHPSDYAKKLLCDFLSIKSSTGKKPSESFFNWGGSNNFGETVTYRTFQRTIFKNNKNNKNNENDFSTSID